MTEPIAVSQGDHINNHGQKATANQPPSTTSAEWSDEEFDQWLNTKLIALDLDPNAIGHSPMTDSEFENWLSTKSSSIFGDPTPLDIINTSPGSPSTPKSEPSMRSPPTEPHPTKPTEPNPAILPTKLTASPPLAAPSCTLFSGAVDSGVKNGKFDQEIKTSINTNGIRRFRAESLTEYLQDHEPIDIFPHVPTLHLVDNTEFRLLQLDRVYDSIIEEGLEKPSTLYKISDPIPNIIVAYRYGAESLAARLDKEKDEKRHDELLDFLESLQDLLSIMCLKIGTGYAELKRRKNKKRFASAKDTKRASNLTERIENNSIGMLNAMIFLRRHYSSDMKTEPPNADIPFVTFKHVYIAALENEWAWFKQRHSENNTSNEPNTHQNAEIKERPRNDLGTVNDQNQAHNIGIYQGPPWNEPLFEDDLVHQPAQNVPLHDEIINFFFPACRPKCRDNTVDAAAGALVGESF